MNVIRWQDQAGCRGEPIWLFFGEDGEPDPLRTQRERKAKEVCWGCPVRDECLEQAFLVSSTGVRGGMTDAERTTVRRRWLRRGYLVSVPGGYELKGRPRGQIECDHCLRPGPWLGTGPGGMRLRALCHRRWVRAGRPDQVPDSEPTGAAA